MPGSAVAHQAIPVIQTRLCTLAGLRQESRRLSAEVFQQEQAAENIRSKKDPDRMASYVMTVMMGMAAMARGGADLAELEGVIELAMESI